MGGKLNGRVAKLEQALPPAAVLDEASPIPPPEFWGVLAGKEKIEDLDPADRAECERALARWDEGRRQRLEANPLLPLLRAEWARLGMPDPGRYDDVNFVEEIIRLTRLPDPPATTPL